MSKESMTLRWLVDNQAEVCPEVPAFVYSDDGRKKTVSRYQFACSVRSAASYLVSRKITGNVCVLSENSIEYVTVLFALCYCGSTAVILNPAATCSIHAYEIEKTESTTVLYSSQFKEKVCELECVFSGNTEYVCIDEVLNSLNGINTGTECPMPDDTAVIMFTSGSTGVPKGVMMSHRGIIAGLSSIRKQRPVNNNTVAVLPLCHVYAFQTSLMFPFSAGGTVYICTEPRRFVRDIVLFRPDYVSLVPGFIKILLTEASKLKGDTLREKLGGKTEIIYSGGATVSDELYDAFNSSGVLLCNGYGLTESGGVVTVSSPEHFARRSLGYPLSLNEIKISETGEILVRCVNIMKGYCNEKQETERALEGGWLHTGDLGYIDDNGMLWYTGRIKNLIILSNGVNVPAEAIESEFTRLDYVLGVKAGKEKDVIIVEVFPDFSVHNVEEKLQEEMNRANKKLPDTWHISRIVIRDTDFNRSDSGKIICDR